MRTVQMAAAELADVLEQENAALSRLDLPTVTGLLNAKRAALEAFQSFVPQTNLPYEVAAVVDTDKSMRATALRLQLAAVENRRLLERAMTAQQYIMSLLAQAARQATPSRVYGALGAYVGRPDGAFALSARA